MVATMNRAFSPEECRRILALGSQQAQRQGMIDDSERSPMRRSQVKFLLPDNSTGWLFYKLSALFRRVNAAYQYDLAGFEALQLASYSPGDYYDWHMDLGPGRMSTRKLSLSLQLSDAEDYEGGDLEFMNVKERTPRDIGTLIVFPAFLAHRVTPVKRGTRKSLVAWVSGVPFC